MNKYLLTFLLLFLYNFINLSTTLSKINYYDFKNDYKQIETDYLVSNESFDSTTYIKKSGLHTATWYNMHGHKTASGESFHKDSLTAAYNYSKLGTYLRVTNPNTSQSIVVKVNDRMGYKGNHIDLSKCAFDSIGNTSSGRIKVTVEEVKKI